MFMIMIDEVSMNSASMYKGLLLVSKIHYKFKAHL